MLLNNEKQNQPPTKFLQTKQEDKTFARLLSKEQNSGSIVNHQKGESSFRVMYYGDAIGSVPFLWESRPGTPKHTLFSDTSSIPPLTPPPSYQLSPKTNDSKFQEKGNNTPISKFCHTIFSKLAISSRKTNITPISSSTYSVSSSLSNSSSSYSFSTRENSVPRPISPIYFGLEDDNNDNDDNDHVQQQEPTRSSSYRRRRTLTLCFGTTKNGGSRRRSRGRRYLEVKSLREGFLSIFASHGTA
ncbi:hypothetical protein Leryth_007598 [Lithospermum erythrorhizon]|uniref:Uncharacterized protein n=1 Tax=Lithospermum erythrorhizon TaxID=34254 RepID=A0AAV3PKX8_LITER|nr:hypothetical protein Leryth_007598 [Lithospermum erythrorhizon]